MGVVLLKVISHPSCSSATNSSQLRTRLVLHRVLSFLGCFCALSKTDTTTSDLWHYEISVFHIMNHCNGQSSLMSVCSVVCVSCWPWPWETKGSAVLQQEQRSMALVSTGSQEQRAILLHWAKIKLKMRVLGRKTISEGNICLHMGRVLT